MTNTKCILAAFAAGLLVSSNARAERVLINDINQTVTLNRPLDCYSTPEIRIDTSRAEIFDPRSKRLQAVTDTVRTMLNYECPGLSKINFTGSVHGREDVIFRGELLARNNWLVKFLSPTPVGYPVYEEKSYQQAEPWGTAQIKNHSRNGGLSITDLKLGMDIETVSGIVLETFYVEPRYDAESGLMTMQAGGCPANFDLEHDATSASPDWKCLKAWFSDNRVPRLNRLELVQVVNAGTSSVQKRLYEKYGYPGVSEISSVENKAFYRWHENSDTDNRPTQLSASLSETGTNQVITSLTLSGQKSDKDPLAGFSDMGLKL